MSNLFRNSSSNLQSFGQEGFSYITSGTVNDKIFIAVTALEDTVLSVQSLKGDSLTSVSLPMGLTIYGRFNSLTVSSGRVVAYIECNF